MFSGSKLAPVSTSCLLLAIVVKWIRTVAVITVIIFRENLSPEVKVQILYYAGLCGITSKFIELTICVIFNYEHSLRS
jgi:hypothetical protein